MKPIVALGPEVLSFDSWGLVVTGVVITVLWLAFRKMFPEES
jgi:hypothetical protein